MNVTSRIAALSALVLATCIGASQTTPPPDDKALADRLAALRGRLTTNVLDPDVEVFLKAADWALSYDKGMGSGERALVDRALNRAEERFKSLKDGKPAWHSRKGRLVRGY